MGAPSPVDQLAHGTLLAEVEADQRLVAQQQGRVADQGLRHAQPLLLAARETPDGAIGVALRTDRRQRLVDPAAYVGTTGESQARPVPVDPEGHQVAPAQRGAGGDQPLLRDVADPAITAGDRTTEQLDPAAGQRLQPEDGLEQGGLARAVGAEHGQELAGTHVEVEVGPQRPCAERESGAGQADDAVPLTGDGEGDSNGVVRAHAPPRAAATASRFACCQPR